MRPFRAFSLRYEAGLSELECRGRLCRGDGGIRVKVDSSPGGGARSRAPLSLTRDSEGAWHGQLRRLRRRDRQ